MKIKGKWSRQNFENGYKNNRFNFYEFGPVSEIALPINWLGYLLRVEWPTILDPTWYLPRVNEWLTFLEDSQIDHFCFPPSLLHFRPPKTFLSKLCTNCYITVSQSHQIVFKLLRGGKSIQNKNNFFLPSKIQNFEWNTINVHEFQYQTLNSRCLQSQGSFQTWPYYYAVLSHQTLMLRCHIGWFWMSHFFLWKKSYETGLTVNFAFFVIFNSNCNMKLSII